MLPFLLACIGLQAVPEADKTGTDPAGRDPSETGSELDTAGDGNNEPIADAGNDSSGQVGVVLMLDGSGSYDPDGDDLLFDWRFVDKPSGSSASLADKDDEKPQLSPDLVGTYRVGLVVSDGAFDSEEDIVEITVTEDNGTPVANAGADQNVNTGDLVSLDGTGSTDPDGDRLTYQWSFSTKPAGSTASLSSSTSGRPTFQADEDGVFEVSLTVNDGSSSSTSDRVRIVASTDGGGGGGGGGGTSGCGCSDALPGSGLMAALLFAFWQVRGLRSRLTVR